MATPELLEEVSRFQAWAASYPEDSRSGEWECDYGAWPALHLAVRQFLDSKPFASWSMEETRAVLYAIARDNEIEYLARIVREEHATLLIPLAHAARGMGECDDRWQLAEQIGRLGTPVGEEEEAVLLLFVADEHEYVRRRALGALALIGSSRAEGEAARIWEIDDPCQEWARMQCLWTLHRVGSPQLESYLRRAESDSSHHLRAYAERVRRGLVDP